MIDLLYVWYTIITLLFGYVTLGFCNIPNFSNTAKYHSGIESCMFHYHDIVIPFIYIYNVFVDIKVP